MILNPSNRLKTFVFNSPLLAAASLLFLGTSCSMENPSSKGDNTIDTWMHGTYYHSGEYVTGWIGIDEGKIIATSENSEMPSADTTILKNQFIYPGFIDAHAHLVGYANTLFEVQLYGAQSEEEVVERIADFLKNNPNTDFVLGRGWDQNLFEGKRFPTHHKLTEAYPELPIVLSRVDGHGVWTNQKAMDLSGITVESEIDGGLVMLVDGQPSGIFIDNAEQLIETPSVDFEEFTKRLLVAEQNCFAAGITGICDAGLDLQTLMWLDSLYQMEVLTMPLYSMAAMNQENLDYFGENGKLIRDRFQISSFKVYADGALGSRGACLLHPYHDDPGNSGLLIHTPEDFLMYSRQALAMDFQVNTHAIGDSANRLILDTYAQVLEKGNGKRWRIEHAQIVNPEDLAKFGEYNILPSVQPTHATSDMYWAEERLGPERIHHAYSYQSLLEVTGTMPLGTDFPVEDISTHKTFYAAVTRKDAMGYPEGGFRMKEGLTRKQTLEGMTHWAAYAQFQEDQKGQIVVGKYADFTILDTDWLQCDESEILTSTVTATYVRGEQVHPQKK